MYPRNHSPTHSLTHPPTHSQETEYIVTRDQDEKSLNMEVGQRLFVHVPPSAIMGFEMSEIDSAPIL